MEKLKKIKLIPKIEIKINPFGSNWIYDSYTEFIILNKDKIKIK